MKYVLCGKKITWDRTEVEYCKIRLWFTSNITCGFIYKHILRCTYDTSQNNWIGPFCNLLYTDERTKSNHKTVELWDSTYVYTYYFYILISIFIITFFDVRTELNNHILQCFDIKCMYNIEPLKTNYHILQSSKVLFSKCNQLF